MAHAREGEGHHRHDPPGAWRLLDHGEQSPALPSRSVTVGRQGQAGEDPAVHAAAGEPAEDALAVGGAEQGAAGLGHPARPVQVALLAVALLVEGLALQRLGAARVEGGHVQQPVDLAQRRGQVRARGGQVARRRPQRVQARRRGPGQRAEAVPHDGCALARQRQHGARGRVQLADGGPQRLEGGAEAGAERPDVVQRGPGLAQRAGQLGHRAREVRALVGERREHHVAGPDQPDQVAVAGAHLLGQAPVAVDQPAQVGLALGQGAGDPARVALERAQLAERLGQVPAAAVACPCRRR